MHPRNPFTVRPPNYADLAVAQPELSPLFVIRQTRLSVGDGEC